MVRPITWKAHQTSIDFDFTGGIIVISNVNLADTVPEIRAIKTRVNVLSVEFSADEIKALMKQICTPGYKYGDLYLAPEECLEVRDFVVSKLELMKRNLDLRLMMNGFPRHAAIQVG